MANIAWGAAAAAWGGFTEGSVTIPSIIKET